MKILLILLCMIGNVHAMRCGTNLVNEGDSLFTTIQYCGHPTYVTDSDYVYMNLEGSGMNYYLHINIDQTIERISWSRS